MSKMLLRAVVVAALGVTLALPGSVSADAGASNGTAPSATLAASTDPPIPVDATSWTPFNWSFDGHNIEGPFTFSISQPGVVKVTDVACRGDQFEIFDFGVSIGTTPAVPVDEVGECDPYITDPDVAFEDPSYTHGSFVLPPGSHSITIVAITNPFSAGTGFIRVDSSPLPTSKDQCMNGGWRTYGIFNNQGDCVSFVATDGKNQPGNTNS
jgi:hypothetical protein